MSAPFAQIDKVFVTGKTTTPDIDDRKISTLIHWPKGITPLHGAPKKTTNNNQTQRRVCCLILHPHPKFGGDVDNNVVDATSNILANGFYLTAQDHSNLKKDGTPSEFLYSVSHIQDQDMQQKDLLIQKDPKTNGGLNYRSAYYGDLKVRKLIDVNEAFTLADIAADRVNVDTNNNISTDDNNNNNNNQDIDNQHTTTLTNPTFISNATNGGIITVRYNQSGVQDSDGKSTWGGTGVEVDDFHCVLQWILSPVSKIFPTDLFIMGYSFGACVASTGLNRLFNYYLYKQGDKPSFFPQENLFNNLHSVLRGIMLLSLPAGFVPRTVFAGQHISPLRSLHHILLHDGNDSSNIEENNNVNENNNNNKSELQQFLTMVDKVKQTPNVKNTFLTPKGYFNKSLFVLDANDEYVGPQTLVNLLSTIEYPQNDNDAEEQRQKLLLLLNTHTGHFWSAKEHIVATILNQFICTRLFIHYGANIMTKDKQPRDITYPPKPYVDDVYRVYFHDLNIWVVFVIFLMVFGRVAYGRYEASLQAAAQQQNALIEQHDEISQGLADIQIVGNLISHQDAVTHQSITPQQQQQQQKQNNTTIDIKPEEVIQIDPNLYVNNNNNNNNDNNKDQKHDEL